MTKKRKDSGVEWIGEIPTHWEMKKVKAFLRERSEKNHADEEVLSLYRDFGVIPKHSRSDNHNVTSQDTSSYKFVKKDNVVINKMKAWQGSLAVSKYQGIISPAYYIYEIKNTAEIVPEFLHYALRNPLYIQEYKRLSAGLRVGQWDLNKSEFNSLLYPIPSVEGQLKIVKFLNEKIVFIDQIIEETQQSIEEIKKYKQSLITEAVTKGLDKNVEMRDSGVEWLRRIPKHWAILRIKNILNERVEKSITGVEEPLSMSQKFGLIPSKDMESIPYAPASYIGNKKVSVKDLVFNKLKAHLGVFAVSKYEGIVSPDYAVYQANEMCDVKYLEYLFKTPQAISEFIKYSRGIGAGLTRLYTHEFFNIKIALPSVEEQREIVKHLNGKSTAINNLIREKEKIIEELEQYKKSLIYEYVTGKKEV